MTKIIKKIKSRHGAVINFLCDYCGELVSCDESLFKKSKRHFCSAACHGAYRKGSQKPKRDAEMIKKALLPNETLDSVGKVYGLTRERVRQIVEGAGVSYKEVKTNLRKASKYFRCLWCGRTIKDKHQKKFCSKACRRFHAKYDFKTILVCQNCGNVFYPFLNWRSMKAAKKYCSMLCYFEKKGKEKILSDRFVKKLKEEFAKREHESL